MSTDSNGPAYFQLRDLRERPELLHPPPVILPRLGWEGRVTLLAAPEKNGKSTLLGQACAAKAEGADFLGDPVEAGVVLWFALDEPLSDVVRRLCGYGAQDRVVISPERPSPPQLEAAIQEYGARLVIIDTLTEFAAGAVEDLNQAVQWQPVLRFLRTVMQRTGAACVLVHHTGKASGRYRDSSQIGAGVDAIIEMSAAEEDSTVRRFRTRGRMRMEDFRLRFVGETYELEDGELPLEMRVYRAIESQPGIGLGRLRKAVSGGSAAIDACITDLVRTGAVKDAGDENGHAYSTSKLLHAWTPQARVGKGDGKAEPESLSDERQGESSSRQGVRQPHLAALSKESSAGKGSDGAMPCGFCGTQQRQRTDGQWRCPTCCPDNRWRVA